jgi:hypothetical protein
MPFYVTWSLVLILFFIVANGIRRDLKKVRQLEKELDDR